MIVAILFYASGGFVIALAIFHVLLYKRSKVNVKELEQFAEKVKKGEM